MTNDSRKLEYLELVAKHKQRIRYMLINNGPETDNDTTLI